MIGSNLLRLNHRLFDGSTTPATVLTITHNLDLVMGWSHVGLFVKGQLAEYGVPRALRARRGLYYQLMARIESIKVRRRTVRRRVEAKFEGIAGSKTNPEEERKERSFVTDAKSKATDVNARRSLR